jgi:exonuclease VII large subunit
MTSLVAESAQVRSVDVIEAFRGALARFEQRVQDALETLSGETRRAADWLEHERPAHWKEQTRLADDALQQAKLELHRCLMYPVDGERPSCREERANLKKAQTRVDYCHEKTERVKHWKRQLHHELFEYEGRIGHLRRMLETDLPRARIRLQQIVRRLDAYQIEHPPESSDTEARSKVEDSEQQDFTEKQ